MREQKQQFMFTPEVLQTIIDKKLTMYQYYDYLYPILKSSAASTSSAAAMESNNNRNTATYSIQICSTPPISKVPQQTANILRNIEACSMLFIPKTQSYSYQTISQCLQSAAFIQKLHPYINSLLTTTNIGIIKQTLTVYAIFQTQIQRILALNRIVQAVNILTLYQIEKNVTNVCCSIQEINCIFGKIGLLCTQEQYAFYYEQVWAHIKEEIITVGHALNSRKQCVKYLQIYDILPLAIEMFEISILKNKLIEWMNSEDFQKYQYQNKMKKARENNTKESETGTKRKQNKMKDRDRERQRDRERSGAGSCANWYTKDNEIKELMEQNLDVVKMRIKYMGSMDLIKQLKKRGYQIDKHSQKYAYFRKQYLQITEEQHKIRKFVSIQPTKSTKNMPLNILQQTLSLPGNTQSSKNPSSFSNASNKIQNPSTLTGFFQQQRCSTAKQNQKTREQQQFNKKVLNGYFVREFIRGEIIQGNAQAVLFEQRMRDSGDHFSHIVGSQVENKSEATTQSNINVGNVSYCDFVDVGTEKQNKKIGKIDRIKNKNTISAIKENNDKIDSNNEGKKKMQMGKMCSIDFGVTFSQYSSSRPATPQKRQNKLATENYQNNLMVKVKSQPFFGLGAKILMR